MIAKISSHHSRRYRISHCPNKIPLFPKRLLPQMLLQLCIFHKHLTEMLIKSPTTLAIEYRGGKFRKTCTCSFATSNSTNSKLKSSARWRNTCSRHRRISSRSIFRCPDQLIIRVVNRMAHSFQRHAPMVSQPGPASGRLNTSSPLKERGFHVHFSDQQKETALGKHFDGFFSWPYLLNRDIGEVHLGVTPFRGRSGTPGYQ